MHDRLLDVKTVFGLVKHHAVFGINNFVRNFLTAVSGQAMHKNSVWLSNGKQLPVYLIWQKHSLSRLSLCFLPHACPNVGINNIGVFRRFSGVIRDMNFSSGLLCFLDRCIYNLVL